jgi:hypothetical protein
MIVFLAHFLFILAAWTLVIKFILPIGFALAQSVPIGTYILWDFWWIVHIALGSSLLHWRRYTFAFALVVSIVEIAIVAIKLTLFLSAPQWTIWQTNWFVNKLFVLACFVLMLGFLVTHASQLRGRVGIAQPVAH